MTGKEKNYQKILSYFKKEFGVAEEELLEVFWARENGDEKALVELCSRHQAPKLHYGYIHFAVAYRQLLRERGELKD